jgi:hypothetical protein
MNEQLNEKTNLLAEMVVGILSADGRLSRDELRALRDMSPQYINELNRQLFDRMIDGFNGFPEFYLASKKLNDFLSNEEKIGYYNFFEAIAESDELDPREENLLNQLKETWGIK